MLVSVSMIVAGGGGRCPCETCSRPVIQSPHYCWRANRGSNCRLLPPSRPGTYERRGSCRVYCRCSTSPASRRPTRGLHARWGRAPAGAHPRRLSPPQRPGQQGCGGGGVRRNERTRTCPPRRRRCVCVRWRVAGAIGSIGRACLAAVGGPDRSTQEAKRVGRRVRAGAVLWGYKKGHARGLAPSGRRERQYTPLPLRLYSPYWCYRARADPRALPGQGQDNNYGSHRRIFWKRRDRQESGGTYRSMK